MFKKLHFALLFCTLHFAFTTLFAFSDPKTPLNHPHNADICDVPPPDSFRITSVSNNFISLAWKPVWFGADHQLSVFKKNASGEWDSLYIYHSVPDANYTINNLESGSEYRFTIATNCINGNASEFRAFLDGITLILELTTQGRVPINPTQINCFGIDYKNPKNKWLGFKVSHKVEGSNISSLFEFEHDGALTVRIKRVDNENPLVAANELKIWPTSFVPIVESPFSIRMGKINSNGIDLEVFGHVLLNLNNYPTTVDMCPDNYPLWDNSYTLQVFSATNVANTLPIGNDERSINNLNPIRAKSPFKETLDVFMPEPRTEGGMYKIRLINTSGQVIFEQQYESSSGTISLPVGSILPGFYLLRIELEGEIQILKVIKSE